MHLYFWWVTLTRKVVLNNFSMNMPPSNIAVVTDGRCALDVMTRSKRCKHISVHYSDIMQNPHGHDHSAGAHGPHYSQSNQERSESILQYSKQMFHPCSCYVMGPVESFFSFSSGIDEWHHEVSLKSITRASKQHTIIPYKRN